MTFVRLRLEVRFAPCTSPHAGEDIPLPQILFAFGRYHSAPGGGTRMGGGAGFHGGTSARGDFVEVSSSDEEPLEAFT